MIGPFAAGGVLPSGYPRIRDGEVPLIAKQGSEFIMPTKSHMRHAGKCGDVFKHFALAELLSHYVRSCSEDHPILFIDTHAGRGLYNIRDCPDRTIFEVPVDAMPPAFRHVAHQTFPPFYPGSPAIANRILRPGDYRIFTDTNKAELDLLYKYLGGDVNLDSTVMGLTQADGYRIVRDVLGLHRGNDLTSIIFLDPTYEDPDDWTKVAAVARIAAELRPANLHATVVWYPILEGHHTEISVLHRRLAEVAHETGGTLLHQEVRVGREPGSNMIGAGMFFVKVMPGTQQALQRAVVAGNGIYDFTEGNLFGPSAWTGR